MADSITPFWNKKSLKPPGIKCIKMICKTPEVYSCRLAEILESVISHLSDLKLLHCDAAVISRLLYRTKRMLRTHKAYKNLQKVRQCLSNYLSLDMLSVVTEIRHCAYGTSGPSREVLEWGMLSLQRFAALFHRLQNICHETANYMHNYISTGNTWDLAMMFLGCLSRIWTIAQFLIKKACEWYLALTPFLSQLQSTERWLPSYYQLPSDLKSWLGNPEYLKEPVRNVDIQQEDEILSSKNVHVGLTFNEDLGEVVSRSDISNKISKPSKNIIKLNKIEDISDFIKQEQRFRQAKKITCRTRKLNDARWTRLKNYLNKMSMNIKSAKDRNISLKLLNQAQEELNKTIS